MMTPLITVCLVVWLNIRLLKIRKSIRDATLNLRAMRLDVFILVRHNLLNIKDVALAEMTRASNMAAFLADNFMLSNPLFK